MAAISVGWWLLLDAVHPTDALMDLLEFCWRQEMLILEMFHRILQRFDFQAAKGSTEEFQDPLNDHPFHMTGCRDPWSCQ